MSVLLKVTNCGDEMMCITDGSEFWLDWFRWPGGSHISRVGIPEGPFVFTKNSIWLWSGGFQRGASVWFGVDL